MKDKLFFFLNTEEQRREFPARFEHHQPDRDRREHPHTGMAAELRARPLPAATPAQCAAINSTLTRFFGVLPRTANQEPALGKIDWRPNDRNSFSASFNYEHFNSPNGIQTGAVVTSGGAMNSNGIDDVQRPLRAGALDTGPTSNMVNEARFGWFKDRQADSVNPALLDPDSARSAYRSTASPSAPATTCPAYSRAKAGSNMRTICPGRGAGTT